MTDRRAAQEWKDRVWLVVDRVSREIVFLDFRQNAENSRRKKYTSRPTHY